MNNKHYTMNRTDIEKAQNIVDAMTCNRPNAVKRIKNDKGLIERIEIDRVVLTEDNKMLLKD